MVEEAPCGNRAAEAAMYRPGPGAGGRRLPLRGRGGWEWAAVTGREGTRERVPPS